MEEKIMTLYYAVHAFRLTCRRRLTFTKSVGLRDGEALSFRTSWPQPLLTLKTPY